MKSTKLLELSKLNSGLSKGAWSNYQTFLGSVLRSQTLPGIQTGLAAFEKQDWDGLLGWADGLTSTEYETAREHRVYHQVASLIRKYPFPPGTVTTDPEGRALEIFAAAEHKCRRVNQRFRAFVKVRSPHEQVLNRARSWISYVLGDLCLSRVWSECSFGAGASLGVHGGRTNLARKLLAKEWTVTAGAYYYARAALKDDIHIHELLNAGHSCGSYFSVDADLFNTRFAEKAKLVGHNKLSFVPKDARVLRTIATEPLLNGYLQKGIDSYMRKRLKRVGIDLQDQSANQRMARKGSLKGGGGEATIDLSSASDSISIELCRFLLPPDWFDFLNAIRSHEYELKGRRKVYHKFTSMGNGFCFPLETLIFASLCHAVGPELSPGTDFLVYGDDIIVPPNVFDHLLPLLKVCGFKVNPKKTFKTGPFRESCGADWFEGEDVRPIILDYAFDSFENVAKFYNGLTSKEHWNVFFYESKEFLLNLIPQRLRFCRPFPGNPDTAFEVPWDVFMTSRFARFHKASCSWTWLEIVKTAKPDKLVSAHVGYNVALMAGALRGALSTCPFSERFTARTNVRRVGHPGAHSLFLPDMRMPPRYERAAVTLSG